MRSMRDHVGLPPWRWRCRPPPRSAIAPTTHRSSSPRPPRRRREWAGAAPPPPALVWCWPSCSPARSQRTPALPERPPRPRPTPACASPTQHQGVAGAPITRHRQCRRARRSSSATRRPRAATRAPLPTPAGIHGPFVGLCRPRHAIGKGCRLCALALAATHAAMLERSTCRPQGPGRHGVRRRALCQGVRRHRC